MKKAVLLIGLLTFLCLGVVSLKIQPYRGWLEEVDYNYFQGVFFSLLGKEYGDYYGDVAIYKKFLPQADYAWLGLEKIYIAHALGEKSNRNENTPLAFSKALQIGIAYFEVDIYKSIDNELVCKSNDSELHLQAKNLCSIDWLINKATTNDIYIILDIKSDFKSTISIIEKKVRNSEAEKKIIPQIYSFNQLAHVDLSVFAGPLFTAYRSNKSVSSLLQMAISLGLPVITIPSNYFFLSETELQLPDKTRIFSHGIKTVEMVDKLDKLGVTGFYLSNNVLINL